MTEARGDLPSARNDAPSAAQRGLRVRGLRVSRGTREVLCGVDLDVPRGEIHALMGSSGAGKTTVLRALAALEPFTAGTVDVDGVILGPGALPPQSSLRALRERVGMVFQAHALFEHLSALDNVALAPVHALGWPRARAVERARALLAQLGVAGRADALPRQLSGGEAQRVAIARALAPDPHVLLLDEPTAALDPARRGSLGDTLRALAGAGRALLLATHDLEFARAVADRVSILADGVLVESGEPASVLVRPRHEATRALLRGPEADDDPVVPAGTQGPSARAENRDGIRANRAP